jgi:ribosomal protein L2
VSRLRKIRYKPVVTFYILTLFTFDGLLIKLCKMTTVTVKINSKSRRGKHILAILADMAKLGNDIEMENIPNAETIKAIEDVRKGNVTRCENVSDLMAKLKS